MTLTLSIAGCDISRAHIDLCLLDDTPGSRPRHRQVPNDRLEAMAQELKRQGCRLVVFEASGGYERPLRQALAAAGLPAAMVNPRHVRAFARASGLLAKTDRLDAAVLARYGQRMDPDLTPLPGREQEKLRDLLRRRDQLITMRISEKQNLAKAHDAEIRADITAMTDTLTQAIRDMQDRIRHCIRASAEMAAQAGMLRSMPGIGPVLAAMMIARLPELGQLNRRQIAALAGLAPHACESGAFKGQRHIWGGRADLRSALYMGAVAVIRRPGPSKAFYDHLKAQGKPSKVALIAVMRKMIITLNAMIKTKTHFSTQHGC